MNLKREDFINEQSWAASKAVAYKELSKRVEKKDIVLAKKYNNLGNCYQDISDHLATKLEK